MKKITAIFVLNIQMKSKCFINHPLLTVATNKQDRKVLCTQRTKIPAYFCKVKPVTQPPPKEITFQAYPFEWKFLGLQNMHLTLRKAMAIVKVCSIIRQRHFAHHQHCIPSFIVCVTSFPTIPPSSPSLQRTTLPWKTCHENDIQPLYPNSWVKVPVTHCNYQMTFTLIKFC